MRAGEFQPVPYRLRGWRPFLAYIRRAWSIAAIEPRKLSFDTGMIGNGRVSRAKIIIGEFRRWKIDRQWSAIFPFSNLALFIFNFKIIKNWWQFAQQTNIIFDHVLIAIYTIVMDITIKTRFFEEISLSTGKQKSVYDPVSLHGTAWPAWNSAATI